MTGAQPLVPSLQKLRYTDCVKRDKQATFRNTLGRQLLQGPFEVRQAHLPCQGLLEGAHHVAHVHLRQRLRHLCASLCPLSR